MWKPFREKREENYAGPELMKNFKVAVKIVLFDNVNNELWDLKGSY